MSHSDYDTMVLSAAIIFLVISVWQTIRIRKIHRRMDKIDAELSRILGIPRVKP